MQIAEIQPASCFARRDLPHRNPGFVPSTIQQDIQPNCQARSVHPESVMATEIGWAYSD